MQYPIPVITIEREEEWLKGKVKFPLRFKPIDPDNNSAEEKECYARSGESAERVLSVVFKFKEIVLAVLVVNPIQDLTAGRYLMSEESEDNWHEEIEGLGAI